MRKFPFLRGDGKHTALASTNSVATVSNEPSETTSGKAQQSEGCPDHLSCDADLVEDDNNARFSFEGDEVSSRPPGQG